MYTEDWDETRAAFLGFVEERRAKEAGDPTPGHLSDEPTDDDYDLLTDGGGASSEGRSPSGRSSGRSPREDGAIRASSELHSDDGEA